MNWFSKRKFTVQGIWLESWFGSGHSWHEMNVLVPGPSDSSQMKFTTCFGQSTGRKHAVSMSHTWALSLQTHFDRRHSLPGHWQVRLMHGDASTASMNFQGTFQLTCQATYFWVLVYP